MAVLVKSKKKKFLAVLGVILGIGGVIGGLFGIIDSSVNSNFLGIFGAIGISFVGCSIAIGSSFALCDSKKEDRESCDREGSNSGVVKSKKEEANRIVYIHVGILCVAAGTIGFTVGTVGLTVGLADFPGGMVGSAIALCGGIGLCVVGGIAYRKGGGDFYGGGD